MIEEGEIREKKRKYYEKKEEDTRKKRREKKIIKRNVGEKRKMEIEGAEWSQKRKQ
jgi:hypothetical protein